MLCSICGGHHHAASCKHRLKQSVRRDVEVIKPLAFSDDELNALAYRAKENRPLARVDLDRLIAVAREFNIQQKPQPASAPAVNLYVYNP